MSFITDRLRALNIQLPALSGPFGAYVPAKRLGDLVYVAGQLPMKDGKLMAMGHLPVSCTMEQARCGARQCVINALAAVNTLGLLDQLSGVLKVGAFVCSERSFHQQPQVANAASELLIEIFGDAGKHVRYAVGLCALPMDAALEIEFVFTINPSAK